MAYGQQNQSWNGHHEAVDSRKYLTTTAMLYFYKTKKKWRITGLDVPNPDNFHRKCSYELYSLVPSDLTFTCQTCHARYTGMNHPHPFCILLVRTKFYLDRNFQRITTLQNKHLIPTILTSSSLRLTIIFPSYPRKLNFLPPPLPLMQKPNSVILFFDSLLGLVLVNNS